MQGTPVDNFYGWAWYYVIETLCFVKETRATA